MAKKKKPIAAPSKNENGGEKKKGKMTKAREKVREEIRAILAAAREKNLIQKTVSTVSKARSFTTEDIYSFIGDLKFKTKEEVKKVIPRRAKTPTEVKKDKVSEPEKKKAQSYYDRWYDLVTNSSEGIK